VARAAVLGAGFEGTSGGRPRQARAPGLLRQALGLHAEPTTRARPAWDAGDVLVDPVEAEPTLERIRQALARVRETAPDALPVLLGGEHTVSLAAIDALEPGSIVSLDAHPDLWEDQHGRSIAQGTWLRRALERHDVQAALLGARAARGPEQDAMDELGVATTLPADLAEPVYLTVDVDVFDPGDAPAVVWPEAEGPSIPDVLGLVERVAADRELAGVDVVEVNAPRPGPTVDLAARVLQTVLTASEEAANESAEGEANK
jgi:agmatinase